MTDSIHDSIGFNLFIANTGIKAGLTRALRTFNITPEQYTILSLLNENEGLQQSVISDLLFKDRPNTSRILERLQKKRLVRRETDSHDRRAVLVYMTESGKKIFPDIEKTVIEFRAKAYSGLSKSDQQQLKYTLNLISTNLS